MKPPVFKTKQFRLRPFYLKDAESLVKHINDKSIARYTLTIPYPYYLKDAYYWLKKVEKRKKSKKLEVLNWAIEIDSEAVGGISLEKIYVNHKAEVGYWLSKKYRGQGIMSEAVKQVVDYGFKELNLKRIWAGCFTNNPASQKVLKKNGFKLEGILRKEHIKNSRFTNDCIFAKIK